MKNYKISSGQIPFLVRLAADLFREMNHEIDKSPQKAIHMHYVADLIKSFVDTAYPIKNEDAKVQIKDIICPTTEEAEYIAMAILNSLKSPKAGEF